jgi:hypothetical protein
MMMINYRTLLHLQRRVRLSPGSNKNSYFQSLRVNWILKTKRIKGMLRLLIILQQNIFDENILLILMDALLKISITTHYRLSQKKIIFPNVGIYFFCHKTLRFDSFLWMVNFCLSEIFRRLAHRWKFKIFLIDNSW